MLWLLRIEAVSFYFPVYTLICIENLEGKLWFRGRGLRPLSVKGEGGLGVPFGSQDGPFGGREFGWGVHCCSAGSHPHFCLGLAPWAWSCKVVRDAGVLSWGLFGDLWVVATWWGVWSTFYFVAVVAEFRMTIYCRNSKGLFFK